MPLRLPQATRAPQWWRTTEVKKMVTLTLKRYQLKGVGSIEFADGRSGSLRVELHVDETLKHESHFAGRADLIAAAVAQGTAELCLQDGADLLVTVSAKDERHAAIKPIARSLPDLENDSDKLSLYIVASAMLVISMELAGPVVLQVRSFNGAISGSAELSGDHALLQAAHDCENVSIEFCGLSFDAQVYGWDKDTGALVIVADSMFEAFGRHATKSRQKH
jgi:hypothetical protein